jgi:hypothetical protein
VPARKKSLRDRVRALSQSGMSLSSVHTQQCYELLMTIQRKVSSMAKTPTRVDAQGIMSGSGKHYLRSVCRPRCMLIREQKKIRPSTIAAGEE